MTATAKSQGPLFTRRALFTLIWPLLLEQTLSVTMGMADTLMVAGVGEAAVSSVSLVDSLNILIIQILSALATGGAVIASQYLGRRDEENASRSAAQLYSVLGISTVAVGVVCMLLSRLILRMVFGSIDEDVMRFAQQYTFKTIYIYHYFLPFLVFILVSFGYSLGGERKKTSLPPPCVCILLSNHPVRSIGFSQDNHFY